MRRKNTAWKLTCSGQVGIKIKAAGKFLTMKAIIQITALMTMMSMKKFLKMTQEENKPEGINTLVTTEDILMQVHHLLKSLRAMAGHLGNLSKISIQEMIVDQWEEGPQRNAPTQNSTRSQQGSYTERFNKQKAARPQPEPEDMDYYSDEESPRQAPGGGKGRGRGRGAERSRYPARGQDRQWDRRHMK